MPEDARRSMSLGDTMDTRAPPPPPPATDEDDENENVSCAAPLLTYTHSDQIMAEYHPNHTPLYHSRPPCRAGPLVPDKQRPHVVALQRHGHIDGRH